MLMFEEVFMEQTASLNGVNGLLKLKLIIYSYNYYNKKSSICAL
jgi:hypothetical protein